MVHDCVFCRILEGELPGTFVYKDEVCSAFMDIQPVNPGHVLVVPNVHGEYLADLDPETCSHLMRVAHGLAAALRSSGVKCEGVNLFLADGEAAMQEVPHVHLHVLPRYRGDGFGLTFGPSYRQLPERSELERIAACIRGARAHPPGV